MDTGTTPPPVIDPGAPDWLPGPSQVTPPAPARRSGLRLWLVIVLALALGVAVAVAAGDWAGRTQEMQQLVSAIEDSEASMTTAMAAVSAVGGDEALISGDEIGAQLSAAAEEGLKGVQGAGARIAALQIQPWHPDVEAARAAYLEHSQAWQDYLSAAAEDAQQWFEDYPEIETTWEALAPVLSEAVPSPAILSLHGRVDGILRDQGDGSTLSA